MKSKKKSPRLIKKLTSKSKDTTQTNTPVLAGLSQPIKPRPVLQAQTITLAQFLEQAKQKNPQAFGAVVDQRALAITRVMLLELQRAIEAMPEGAIFLPVLGTFTAEQVCVENQPGEYNTIRQVSFKATPNKPA